MALATPELSEHPVSPRRGLLQWFQARIDGLPEWSIDELADNAFAEVSRHPEWIKSICMSWVRERLTEFSAHERPSGYVPFGDRVIDRDGPELQERADALMKKWGRWAEHDGNQYVRLLEMTRSQLLIAAEQRERAARTERVRAELCRMLADVLEEGQQVKDCVGPEELERMEATAVEHIRAMEGGARGNL